MISLPGQSCSSLILHTGQESWHLGRGTGGLGVEPSLLADGEGGLWKWAAFFRKQQWGRWKGCAPLHSPQGGLAWAPEPVLSSADGHSVAGPAPSATSAWGLLHPLPTHSCCLSARRRGWSGCLFPPSLNPAAGFVGGYNEPEPILSGLCHGTSFLIPLPRCSAPSTWPCPGPTTFPGAECALHPL